MKFPRHDCSLTLAHNAHRDVYNTLAQACDERDSLYDPWYDAEAWISEEQRQKAIATNEVWTLHWYPNSPVGFHHCHAADLDALMEYVNREFPACEQMKLEEDKQNGR
jgi:hypothetical protein